MKIETITIGVTDLERPETVILCALHATLHGLDAKLSRVRVHLMPVAREHVCRVRAWFIRGDVVIVEARAGTGRAAIGAAAKGLRDALAKRSQSPQSATSSHGRSATEPRPSTYQGRNLEIPSLAPRIRVSRAPVRLLLALREVESPAASPAPDWAAVLARELRVELHVLRVLGEVPDTPDLGPHRNWVEVTRDVQRMLDATRETRSWCDEVLPDAAFAEHVCIRVGAFADAVTLRAKEIEPDLIVLSAGEPSLGNMVTGLASGTRRPVLVARKQNSRGMLLAATNLKDDNYPVLRKAAELSNHLHAPVVAFHNVERSWADPGAGRDAEVWGQLWPAIQKERLELAADRLLQDGEVFVSQHDDSATAIVARARDVDAATIVVGTKASSWLDRLAKRSVAAEVVEQTDRSVMVVPVG